MGGGRGSRTKERDEGSEVGAGVGKLLGLNRGTDDENVPSVRLMVNLLNTCLRSGDGGLFGGGMGNSFVSAHGSKIGVIDRSVGDNLVSISGGEIYVSDQGQ